MELSIIGDDITAIYKIVLASGEQQSIKYKISCTTGKEPVKITKITLPEKQDVVVGEEIYLKAHIVPENASVTGLTWQSSDTNIATVDNNGKIKGINKGTCRITVKTDEGNHSATCNIQVKLPTEVNGISLEKEKLKLLLNSTKQPKATIRPATAINTNINWHSLNENVISVDQQGNITAKAIGTATITVTTEEGGYTANCEVTVKDIVGFVTLDYLYVSAVVINGYVTGGLFSRITNHSEFDIVITQMDITDGFGNALGNGATLLPHTISAGKSFDIGSHNFNHVYCPIFIWHINYDEKTYSISHQYGKTDPSILNAKNNSPSTKLLTIKRR